MVIVSDNPTSNFFVRSGVIFFNDLTVQMFVFVPKILSLHFPDIMDVPDFSTRGTSGTSATNLHTASGHIGTMMTKDVSPLPGQTSSAVAPMPDN